jgi:hypothetical protein
MLRQIHSSLYLCNPNLSTDMKRYYASTRPDSFLIRKDIMLLLDQTLFLIRKAMGSGLAKATQVGNDYHLQ